MIGLSLISVKPIIVGLQIFFVDPFLIRIKKMNTKIKLFCTYLAIAFCEIINLNAQEIPDLKWNPNPFLFQKGTSQKYIDFEKGNDNNLGTKEKPWKHHPWDVQATGNAALEKGLYTYVFKKGVTYRGQLKADESGTIEHPIRLTVDPSWGVGEASIVGSRLVNTSWKRYKEKDGLPFPEVSKGKNLGNRTKGGNRSKINMDSYWRSNYAYTNCS